MSSRYDSTFILNYLKLNYMFDHKRYVSVVLKLDQRFKNGHMVMKIILCFVTRLNTNVMSSLKLTLSIQ